VHCKKSQGEEKKSEFVENYAHAVHKLTSVLV